MALKKTSLKNLRMDPVAKKRMKVGKGQDPVLVHAFQSVVGLEPEMIRSLGHDSFKPSGENTH